MKAFRDSPASVTPKVPKNKKFFLKKCNEDRPQTGRKCHRWEGLAFSISEKLLRFHNKRPRLQVRRDTLLGSTSAKEGIGMARKHTERHSASSLRERKRKPQQYTTDTVRTRVSTRNKGPLSLVAHGNVKPDNLSGERVAVSYKVQYLPRIGPCNPTPEPVPKINEDLASQNDVDTNIDSSFHHNSPNLKRTQAGEWINGDGAAQGTTAQQ